MKAQFMRLLTFFLLVVCSPIFARAEGERIVIAHRGASGYLPEHTLAAKALAHGMGADYIEQDLVMTKDDRIVVLHDHHLGGVTNVAAVYPQRKRADGKFYVIDFTLAEIQTLSMTERFRVKAGKQTANFPQRFPLWKSSFRVHTFEEEIELIQGLNKTRGKNVGIYPEIKYPWFYRQAGKDISKAVLRILKAYGYTKKSDRVYLQCFDPNEMRRIHKELFAEFKMRLKLVQLIADSRWRVTMEYRDGKATPYDYDWMLKPGAMKKVAEYADGIGPWLGMVVGMRSTSDNLMVTNLVKDAHAAGLKVHPYTFRGERRATPPYAADFEDLLGIFFNKVGVDGVFTDLPDRAVDFLRR